LPIERLVELVALQEKIDARVRELSGGQRQRLAVALALVNDPEIIFLDEPTTGLDPQARRSLWQVIEGLKKDGKSILLTTHYMEEAERLCDLVAVMDMGKIIAYGSPQELIRQNFQHTALEFATPINIPPDDLQRLPFVEQMNANDRMTTLYSSQTSRTIEALTRISIAHNAQLESFTVRRATLEDVFLKLTGRRILE
jgi:ABC-2 type transport system ATP-binding protein